MTRNQTLALALAVVLIALAAGWMLGAFGALPLRKRRG